MKPWHYILVLGASALFAAFVYLHRQQLGLAHIGSDNQSAQSTVTGNDSSTRPARLSWQTIDRPHDGFKIEMPADVKEIQIPAYTENGGADQVNMIFANPDSTTTFSLSWDDNPPVARAAGNSPDRILDTARDNSLARSQTSLVGEVRNSIAGNPAREFSAKNANGGVMNCRLVYISPRLYMLTAAFNSPAQRRDQDVNRFFNSFVLTGSPIPVAIPPAGN